MRQVTHTLKSGKIEIQDVPVPMLTDKFVLVQTVASVISAGTEKTKIDMGKKSLLQKAKARPDLVRQVLHKLRTDGLLKTLQTVNTRLGTPNPLGYSSAGRVVAVGSLVEGLKPGDRVACGGVGFANHAEFAAVPKNLLTRIPEGVTDEEAAFSTLGAIALQGIRLADPKLGEIVLVLGLGLLGQIMVQLLRANGCTVIGTDLDPKLVTLAEGYGAIGIQPNTDLSLGCRELTSGRGVDAVLVCAGTSSNQPIEQCGNVTREKGRVVVVGAVRMDIPREDYFKKEISLVISRSYGPGRYDPSYEEGGHDYPYGYVRFTEQRNMEAVLHLMAEGRLDVKGLITHRFSFEQAIDAYAIIEGKKQEHYLGIVLHYDNALAAQPSFGRRLDYPSRPIDKSRIGVSFVGAGNYATASLLPVIHSLPEIELRGLVTASGRTATGVANQFGFSFCASQIDELLEADTDVVVITTRHDTHAEYVERGLQAGKHVYVEKPLALDIEGLARIHHAFHMSNGCLLMVGFNRRFAPLTEQVRAHFDAVNGPLVINIRVNAGTIASDHWTQDPCIGGGRIIGEGCHFIDLASALSNSDPVSVFCYGSEKRNKSSMLNDNVCILVRFGNGSVASITYVADGSRAQTKEHVEVFGGARSAVINDFREATLYEGDTGRKLLKLRKQDKGQTAMLHKWIASVRQNEQLISEECLMKTSMATVMAVESMSIGMPMTIDLALLRHADRGQGTSLQELDA